MLARPHQHESVITCPERAAPEPSCTVRIRGKRYGLIAIVPEHQMRVPSLWVVNA